MKTKTHPIKPDEKHSNTINAEVNNVGAYFIKPDIALTGVGLIC